MSFLVDSNEPDEPAFVAEVLELLCFESDWQSSPTAPDTLWPGAFDVPIEAETWGPQGDEVRSAKCTTQTTKRKRKRSARITAKHRIAALRQEITTLKAQLTFLQVSNLVVLPCEPARELGGWEAVAAKQSLERERAETQNQMLRSQLAEQGAITRSLSRLLNDWDRWSEQSEHNLLLDV